MTLIYFLKALALFAFFTAMIAVLRVVIVYGTALYWNRKVNIDKEEKTVLWLSIAYILTYIFV